VARELSALIMHRGKLARIVSDNGSGSLNFCGFRGREDKIVTTKLESGVIPPFLVGVGRRIHAAAFSFWAGVMPPMPMLGRSWL
jgi:hypothetical protein